MGRRSSSATTQDVQDEPAEIAGRRQSGDHSTVTTVAHAAGSDSQDGSQSPGPLDFRPNMMLDTLVEEEEDEAEGADQEEEADEEEEEEQEEATVAVLEPIVEEEVAEEAEEIEELTPLQHLLKICDQSVSCSTMCKCSLCACS